MVYCSMPYFIQMTRLLCTDVHVARGAKNHRKTAKTEIFCQTFKFRAHVSTPFPIRVKFWHARVDPQRTPIYQISSGSVYYVDLRSEKTLFGPIFLRHSAVMAPPSGAETKLNAKARLQTFSYPTRNQNRFYLYFKVVMAKSLAESLPFKSVMDKRNKKNIEFFAPRCAQSPSPTKLGMVIEEVRTIFAHLKCL